MFINFKKIFSIFFILAIFSLSVISVNAQSYEIYVSDVKTEKPVYAVGDTLAGEFTLYNLAAIPQSDIMYVVSSGLHDSETMSLYSLSKASDKMGPLYIKAQSKDVIKFSYTLPRSLSGEAGVEITALLKDGTLVGQGFVPITVVGETTSEKINISNTFLTINDSEQVIGSGVGPTIYDGESVSYHYVIEQTEKKYTLKPTLKLYDRVDGPDSLIKTLELSSIETSIEGSQEYTVELPVELDPRVYYGVITFEGENVDTETVDLRYIIAGPIATIRNISTDSLRLKKGDKFDVTVSYGGQPFDELRSDKQLDAVQASLEIELLNEDGKLISKSNQVLDLNKEDRQITLNFEAQEDAQTIKFNAKIISIDNAVLDTYTTTFPSEKEVKDQKSIFTERVFSKATFISSIILFLLLLIFAIYKKRNEKVKIPLVLLIISATFLFGSVIKDTQAWSMYAGHIFTQEGLFHLTSVASPLPPEVKIYKPGESFSLRFSASYGDCTNDSQYFYAYAYREDSNWSKETPDVKTTPDWAADYNYNKTYWSNKGVELFNASGLNNKFSQGNINNKEQCKALGGSWYTSRGGTGCSFAKYSAKSYSFSKNYTAPTTPGYHTMYFGLFQTGDDKSGNGIHDGTQNATYAQKICVSGAGICPGEEILENACPNLIGVYSETPAGRIFKDGVETSYVKNAAGNCVYSACAPALQPSNFGQSCGCPLTGVVGKIGCSGSCVTSSGTAIPTSCPPFSVTCSASPLSVEPNTNTEFKPKVFSAPGPVTYRWFDEDNVLLGTNEILTRTYSELGSYLVKIKATSGTETVTNTCRVSVAYACSNEHANGQDAGCISGTKHVYVCTPTGWGTTSTGETCDDGTGDGTGDPGDGGGPGDGTGGTPTDANVSLFSFDPDTVSSTTDMCGITLVATNVNSCTLRSSTGVSYLYPGVSGSISKLEDRTISVGRYTLSCEGTNGVTKQFGVRSCIVNPNVRER